MDILGHVKKTVGVRSTQPYWKRGVHALSPPRAIFGPMLRRLVAPRIKSAFASSQRGPLPLSFGRQPVMVSGQVTEPRAVLYRLEPIHGDHALFGLVVLRVLPLLRMRIART